MMYWRSLLVVCTVMMLGGCGVTASAGNEAPSASAPETLSAASKLWEHKAVGDYSVTVQRSCYCPVDLVQPIRLTVVDGKVTRSEGLQQPVENLTDDDAKRLTVDGLFAFIQQAKDRDAHKLEVTYDARYGFPVRVVYDGHPMIADDERTYTLTDFNAGVAR